MLEASLGAVDIGRCAALANDRGVDMGANGAATEVELDVVHEWYGERLILLGSTRRTPAN